MNKKIFLPSCILILCCIMFTWYTSQNFVPPNDYTEAVKYCQPIPIDKAEEKLDNQEKFLLYIGRESCHYCREFAPKLAEAIYKTKINVYYLDSDEGDAAIIASFANKLGIQTIPNLSFYTNGELQSYLEKGSEASSSEIQSFLLQYGK